MSQAGRSRIRVLCVEDDATFRGVLLRELASFGFEANGAEDGERALKLCESGVPDVALLDLRLPGMGGLEVMAKLLELAPDLPIVILTGHGGVSEAVEAMRKGAFDFLTKPTRLDVLEQVILRAAERGRLVSDNRRLRRLAAAREDPFEIRGESEAMGELRDLIARLAHSDAPVLIEGEPGTGKELVARNLHRLSPRAEAPFVVINCGAMPEGLVESELFGHERGAFTGAARRRGGVFDAAGGGTLFLDEIGELPAVAQPALLRVVQFGELKSVGSDETRTVDVRVVAATNRRLAEEVSEGRFREDLFYRLSTLHITVPPLREHREDVGALARFFLQEASQRTGRTLSLQEDAVRRLASHSWPGNVRELQSAVTRLSVLAKSDSVSEADVEAHAFGPQPGGETELPTLDLGQLEGLAIASALRRHGGNKTAAARELGIPLRTLYNRLRKDRSGSE